MYFIHIKHSLFLTRITGSGNEIGGRNVRLWDVRFKEESDWPLIWNAQFDFSQDSWLPATDYPRASRSLPRIAGSENEIVLDPVDAMYDTAYLFLYFLALVYI